MQHFDEWELSLVIDGLAKAQITLDVSAGLQSCTLLDVPPALVYHIVSNIHILLDKRILSFIQSRIPPTPVLGWPLDPLPPGFFYLLLHEDGGIRQWALSQVTKASPIVEETFVGPYITALETLARVLISPGGSAAAMDAVSDITTLAYHRTSFPFSTDPEAMWIGFTAALRLSPAQFLKPGKSTRINICHIITGRLHDPDDCKLSFFKYLRKQSFVDTTHICDLLLGICIGLVRLHGNPALLSICS